MISEVSDKVHDALEYISLAIQNVGVDPNFPRVVSQKQLEIRSAALLLTAAVMDCLATLVGYVAESCEYPSI